MENTNSIAKFFKLGQDTKNEKPIDIVVCSNIETQLAELPYQPIGAHWLVSPGS